MVVKAELTLLGLHVTRSDLGQVDVMEDISVEQRDQIQTALLKSGLELIEDAKSVLIDRIKKVIIELVHYSEEPLAINFSTHLSQLLKHNYTYMANIFSETLGCTIEKYLIGQKIERVKQLLIYDELSLTEIADRMYYSSVAHLSSQFKKITGNTASYYKHLKPQRRMLLQDQQPVR
jgi:YesN/AraC family two-component response regulator